MKLNITIVAFFYFALLMSGCKVKEQTSSPTLSSSELENFVLVLNSNPLFPVPEIPKGINEERDRAIYLANHYWDLFPFSDNSLIDKPDITEQGFVDYIHVLNYIPYDKACNSIKRMLNKAQVNPIMYTYFASLYQKYFYDPNSPFRNEELYIPVLEVLLKSKILSPENNERYTFHKEMIHKNRVGNKAADFEYTLMNGEEKRMHKLKSNYMILLFTNPDCTTCKQVMDEINNSEILKPVFSRNSFNRNMLTVLSIFPDSDIVNWYKAQDWMSQKNWINGYDKYMALTNKRIYDIKAIPTIYFLDKNKRILLKDTSIEEIESFFKSKE